MTTLIKNAQVIFEDLTIQKRDVLVEHDTIVQVAPTLSVSADRVLDAQGLYLSPGFIDIHVHGGNGYDFMDANPEEYLQIAKFHATHGTTTMVPTTVAGELTQTKKVLEAFLQAKDQPYLGAKMAGIHLEGPFVAKERSGALDPQYIKNPNQEEFEKILRWGHGQIIRWTIAPELEGALAMGDELHRRGIIASIGHSDAKMQDVTAALQHGYSLLTHFFSCMSTITRDHGYRSGGIIEAGYYYDDLDIELIADGRHLPGELLKLIYKMKGYRHIALITDAMRGAGFDHGVYMLGGKKDGIPAVIEDGVAKLMDKSAFAGSVATMDWLVRVMIQLADVPLAEAVYMATAKPASILKKTDIGSIAVGKKADLILFDNQIGIKNTMINGHLTKEF